jgi:hypothetical protein
MKTSIKLSALLLTMSLFVLSFQCHKPYKNNHTLQIEGAFQDSSGTPIPYFEFYISHREVFYATPIEQRSSEKTIKTDAHGKFKILTPQLLETRDRLPALVFVDTTWKYEIELLSGEFGQRYFVPFYTNGTTNSNINLGTLIIQQ